VSQTHLGSAQGKVFVQVDEHVGVDLILGRHARKEMSREGWLGRARSIPTATCARTGPAHPLPTRVAACPLDAAASRYDA
jgi:hypothetical protein